MDYCYNELIDNSNDKIDEQICSINEYLVKIKKIYKNLIESLSNDRVFFYLDELKKNQCIEIDTKNTINLISNMLKNYKFLDMNCRNDNFTDLNNINSNTNNIKFFYRGECSLYNLLPSIFRYKNNIDENLILKKIISLDSNEFQNLNNCEILTKLQHYGCPTRLLDITLNPLVALYFACKDEMNNDGYVYVFFTLDKNILTKNNDRTTILTCIPFLEEKNKNDLFEFCVKELNLNHEKSWKNKELPNNTCTNHLYHLIEKETPFEKRIRIVHLFQNFFLMPPYNNTRIERQNGAFIIAGLQNNTFNNQKYIFSELIKNDILFKFKIPKGKKAPILKALDKLGINEQFLFPDLEHCANYYKEKYKKK